MLDWRGPALLAGQLLAIQEDREVLVHVFAPVEHAQRSCAGADGHPCFDIISGAPPGIAHSAPAILPEFTMIGGEAVPAFLIRLTGLEQIDGAPVDERLI